MGLFKKKIVTKTYDKENKKPVIKASICNGEQVAGFKDIHTGKIEEVMLIKNQADLDAFKKMSRKEIVMKKRVLGTLLTVAMLASVLQGCGKQGGGYCRFCS